jgi:hypothetical protein
LKAFHQVNSIKSFLDLGLPIKQYTMPGNSSSTDMSHYEKPTNHVDHNVAFEIDVSHPKRIQRALGLKTGTSIQSCGVDKICILLQHQNEKGLIQTP